METDKDSIQLDVEKISRISAVPKILEVICRTTGMGFAAVARVTDDKWVACSVRDEIAFGLVAGGELKIETTICNEIREHQRPVIIDHVSEDPDFKDHHTPAMYGFQSYISMPIKRTDGTFFGTLCAIDPRPAVLNTPAVTGMFSLYAELIAFHLQAVEQLHASEAELVEERRTAALREEFNRELTETNTELEQTRKDLQSAVNKYAESEEKLRQAIETGRMGTWGINPVTREVVMSDFILEMFGFPTDRHVSIQEILEAIDPEFRQPLTDILTNAIEKHQSSDIEYSLIHTATGERKWVRVIGKVFLDENGNAIEYSGLMTDITERKLDDLRKNDFIGMVSHELKTPLTSLSAYAQMLHAKATKNKDSFTAGALEKVNLQVKKMSSMINGFLNISRLESGKIHLSRQDFDITELMQEIIAENSLFVFNHAIIFETAEPVIIHADKDKISSVISNLISNAVKYSPSGSPIKVKCRVVDNSVQVSVRDEGMGIPPEDISRLFDRYYRVENNNTRNISGFGIGLYLSSEIIIRHGGKIWVKSEIGNGSKFYFSLPLTGSQQ